MYKHVHLDNDNAQVYLRLSLGGAFNAVSNKTNPINSETILGVTAYALEYFLHSAGVEEIFNPTSTEQELHWEFTYGNVPLELTLKIFNGELTIKRIHKV